VSPWLQACILVSVAWALIALGCGEHRVAGVTTAASALYARSDSNATTVWAPRMHVAGKLGDSLGVETAVAMDSWTGASIDVVTAATHAIHEVRTEVTAGGSYEFSHASLGGGYRYSTENDYWSNGGVGTLSIDMADKNTTLALTGFGSRDTVGRAGDPNFKEAQSSAGGRGSLTQIINASTLVQVSWETTHVTGYQAGPYRFVAIGGQGTCASLAPLCVPESVPGERFRHAAVARGKHAFGDHVSLGLEYRFYVDSWAVRSQTISPAANFLLSDADTLALSYRYYTQSEARFYRPRYLDPDEQLSYVTRDRELSALYSNRLGLSYEHDFEIGDGDKVLTAVLRGGVTRYRYLAFVGLTSVDALEGTFLLSLAFR
jgi:hypothetical protein